eukprot:g8773.t1
MGGPNSGGPRRPVICTTTGQVYPSLSEAARDMIVEVSGIHRAIRTGGTCRGKMWAYVDEPAHTLNVLSLAAISCVKLQANSKEAGDVVRLQFKSLLFNGRTTVSSYKLQLIGSVNLGGTVYHLFWLGLFRRVFWTGGNYPHGVDVRLLKLAAAAVKFCVQYHWQNKIRGGCSDRHTVSLRPVTVG